MTKPPSSSGWRVLGPAGWMGVCLLLSTLVYLGAVRESKPRWRAAYFSDSELRNPLVVRDERDVDHDWRGRQEAGPAPSDAVAVRWESCLELAEGGDVAFQLTSEGGARLWIDDELVVDDWEPHTRRTRGIDVPMRAGVQVLRVDYHGPSGLRMVSLAASFDGARPRRIAPERLRSPGNDPQRPCAFP